MTLKYSDDEVTDEEMRQLDLQAAAHQHMMEQDAQQPTTPLLFQQPQDPVQTPAQEEDRYIPGWTEHQVGSGISKADRLLT